MLVILCKGIDTQQLGEQINESLREGFGDYAGDSIWYSLESNASIEVYDTEENETYYGAEAIYHIFTFKKNLRKEL